jgi:hypothetical protein
VLLEGLGQLKNPMTSSGYKNMTIIKMDQKRIGKEMG